MINIVKFLKSKISNIKKYNNFKKEFINFKELDSEKRFSLEWEDKYPCLDDKTNATGFDKHYLYHTAWAARVLKKIYPDKHTDIGSCIRFVTSISAFIQIDYFDYRPPQINLNNLSVKHADLTNLSFDNNSIYSLSCMHVIEHIGLGRYGDALDSDGDLKAISELKRVLAVGGNLLLVVPVGQPKIMFNAHRIYSYDQIITYFSDFELLEFSLIPDKKEDGIIHTATKEIADQQTYGCGCFWFNKTKD